MLDFSAIDGKVCPTCGRVHRGMLGDAAIGKGVIEKLPHCVRKYGGTRAFVLCDRDTYQAAGERVCRILDGSGISYHCHVIERTHPMPDERTVGEAMMFVSPEDDTVIAVGGGVLNDTAKLLAAEKHVPDIIVATAPSMDGFASATSSMERCGLKVSVHSKCPEVVIGDTEILAKAPKRMILSGIGDMLAKYVSVVEWRLSHLINGEYYCSVIAETVLASLEQCVKAAPLAVRGDEDAVEKVMEGLVLSGMTMNYAGVSRPASGMEHYVSHILDMRSLAFGTAADFHGIQCGIATLAVVRAYEKLAKTVPNAETARKSAAEFDLPAWNEHLKKQLGVAAETLIALDEKEQKYDIPKHGKRLESILAHWDEIGGLIASLPSSAELERFMKSLGHPTEPEEIGVSREEFRETFCMAKDIRDKYVLGKLLWDVGLLDEFSETV